MIEGQIKLGGRQFQVVNYDDVSVIHEHYIMSLMRATGLDCVLPLAENAESNEAYMLRLHAALVDTLKLPELLGGYLLEGSQTEADWTLAGAKEVATFIKALRSPEDKAQVHRLGLLVTLDFFRAGVASLNHSRSVLETLSASRPNNANEFPTRPARTAGH